MNRLQRWSSVGILALASSLAGCAYQGQDMTNPAVRRATWFSFVAGDDIRDDCAKGGIDHTRLIYNGFWHDQVRIYELALPGKPRLLTERVVGGASFAYFTSGDWMSPWRGNTAEVTLSDAQYQALVASLEASGLSAPPPVGLRLPSDGYYWTAVACRGGQFSFNAWLYPDDAFARLSFPAVLAGLDRTGVPMTPPDPQSQLLTYSQQQIDRERWIIQVNRDGFSGSF